ncbi:MAG: hypothetical protein ACI30H_03575 [Paludibacteraceae bacterium]
METIGEIYYSRRGAICAKSDDGLCFYVGSKEQNIGLKKGDKISMNLSKQGTIINFIKLT